MGEKSNGNYANTRNEYGDPYGVPTGSVPKLIKANDTQVSGDHYKKYPIQPWDYVAANDLGYFEGSVISYVTRWKDKGGVADLEKARHYLAKLIELQS